MSDVAMNGLNPLYQIFIDLIKDELVKLSCSSYLRIKEFGYRQFLGNGTSIGFCTRNLNTVNSKTCCRAEKINSDHLKIKRFYHQETVNNFVIYRRIRDKIEGFYFLSASKDSEIVGYYLSHLEFFEDFINRVSLCINSVLGSFVVNGNNSTDNNRNTNANTGNINIGGKTLPKSPAHNNLNNLYVEVFGPKSIEELFPSLEKEEPSFKFNLK